MTSRWKGRGIAMQRGLLVVTGVLLFFCYAYLDVQMRCCHDPNAVVDVKQQVSSHSITKSSTLDEKSLPNIITNIRKLSSHAEKDFQKISNEYEGDDLDRWDSMPNLIGRRLPQVIIIGVKKGGTRALLEILRLHPDVRAPGPEIHFFDRHYHRGLEWYRRQMPLSISSQLTMEKTPSYLITPEVPSRIRNMSRDIRLLVVVRDPVTRAVSDYTQASSKRRDIRDGRTFEEMAFLNTSTGLVDTNWSAIRIGVYAKHLERWLRHFPLSRFHFISGERLISDPVSELYGVQRFLGLRPVIQDHHFFFNQTKGFPCLRRTPRSKVPHCLGKTKGRSHPHIPDSAVHRLRDFYRPFNQKFYRMVGREFGWA